MTVPPKTFTGRYRVYYEDTDAGGVVYYANYLKFAERARTDALREAGIVQSLLAEKEGMFFVVRHAELDLKKPARLDDVVVIHTSVAKSGGASLQMVQHLYTEKEGKETALATVKVTVACVDTSFRPARLPAFIKAALC